MVAEKKTTRKEKRTRKTSLALGGRAEKKALGQQKAFQLRAEGMDYREIAEALGVTVSTAWKWVEDHWVEVRAVIQERAELLREYEMVRLNQSLKEWLPIALRQKCTYRDYQANQEKEFPDEITPCDKLALSALDRVLKIGERIAKINGTDKQPELPKEFMMTQEVLQAMLQSQLNGVKTEKSAKPIVLELESGYEGV